MQPKKVAIVTLNYNGLQDTLECLESLKNLIYPDYEIIVVDQASAGNEAELLGQRADNHIIIIANDRNYGFAEGNNIGMRHALANGAGYILLLNNDMVVEPKFLSRLIEVAEADGQVGVVAPGIYDYDPPCRQRYPRRVDRWSPMLHFHLGSSLFILLGGRKTVQQTGRVSHVDGGAMLIKREVLEATGLFDPVYFLGGYEDFDLGTRALRQGYRMMAVVDAKAYHKSRRSWRSRKDASLGYARLNPRNRVIYARKNLPWAHFLLFMLLLPLYCISLMLAEGPRGGGLAVFVAALRGIKEGFMTPVERDRWGGY